MGSPADRTPAKCAAADECHGPGQPDPALPADRTSTPLGQGAKPKPKKHRKKGHKKKGHKKKQGKAKKKSKSNGKQGRA